MNRPVYLTFSICLAIAMTVCGQTTQHAQPGDEYKGIKVDSSAPATTQPLLTKLTIQEDQVVRPVSDWLLGFCDYWVTANRMAIDPNTGKIDKAVVDALRGLPMPLVRMAGTESQLFRWKWAVGPIAQRQPQKLAAWLKPVKYVVGPLEWVDQTRQVDPKAQFAWVLNMNLDTPEDDADLARLFTAGPDDHWGRLRSEYGFTKPVHIAIWELGNEMDYTWGWDVDRYVQTCRQVIQAIRKVIPDAHFAAQAITAPWGSKWKKHDWRQWHRTVLKELGDQIDYITFHPYYDGLPTPVMEKYMNMIRDDISAITGSNRIKIYVSEHARWPKIKDRQLWYQTHSLGGCLSTAQFLNRMFQRPDVTAATYHNLRGGPWSVINGTARRGKFWTTGIDPLFRLLNDSLGKDVVFSKADGPHTDVTQNDMSFTATAMTTTRGLNLLLVNHESQAARSINITTQKTYQVKEELILTGPDLNTHNTVDQDVMKIRSRQVKNMPLKHYDMPARSIVVLKCAAK